MPYWLQSFRYQPLFTTELVDDSDSEMSVEGDLQGDVSLEQSFSVWKIHTLSTHASHTYRDTGSRRCIRLKQLATQTHIKPMDFPGYTTLNKNVITLLVGQFNIFIPTCLMSCFDNDISMALKPKLKNTRVAFDRQKVKPVRDNTLVTNLDLSKPSVN